MGCPARCSRVFHGSAHRHAIRKESARTRPFDRSVTRQIQDRRPSNIRYLLQTLLRRSTCLANSTNSFSRPWDIALDRPTCLFRYIRPASSVCTFLRFESIPRLNRVRRTRDCDCQESQVGETTSQGVGGGTY